MKKLLVLFYLFGQMVFAQDTLNDKMVESFSYPFKLEGKKLKGVGADFLLDKMKQSHFVLLGETHDDAKIATFTNVLLQELNQLNYGYFLTEHGQYGLQLLLDELKKDSSISAGLFRLNSKEYKRLQHYPFPFLKGVEDAQFVSTAQHEGYQMLGLDQEFFYSFPFLFDQLYVRSDRSTQTTMSYEDAIQFLLDQYEKVSLDKNYPLCKNLQESKRIETFFKNVGTSTFAKQIITDIKESWRIYDLNLTKRRESYAERGTLMKTRFSSYYRVSTSKGLKTPKFIIKLGAYHTMRGTTPLGIEDIGETVHQLANQNGQGDVNILFAFRYYLDNEEPLGYFDNAEGNSKWLNERKPIMLQGQLDSWTLIDLKKLDQYTKVNKLFVYKPILELIQRHDYIIIPPATKDVRENRAID